MILEAPPASAGRGTSPPSAEGVAELRAGEVPPSASDVSVEFNQP